MLACTIKELFLLSTVFKLKFCRATSNKSHGISCKCASNLSLMVQSFYDNKLAKHSHKIKSPCGALIHMHVTREGIKTRAALSKKDTLLFFVQAPLQGTLSQSSRGDTLAWNHIFAVSPLPSIWASVRIHTHKKAADWCADGNSLYNICFGLGYF